ncbi:MAG: hypothetical protein IPN48_05355 [Sphingomonadales bacterium]|nr:hypothetical protein [Sphingomonadales bacterium]
MAGAASLLPSVAGLGLNFFLARRLVRISLLPKLSGLARNAWGSRSSPGHAAWYPARPLSNSDLSLPTSPWLAVTILMLEQLSFDRRVTLLAIGAVHLLPMCLCGTVHGSLPFMVCGLRSANVLGQSGYWPGSGCADLL